MDAFIEVRKITRRLDVVAVRFLSKVRKIMHRLEIFNGSGSLYSGSRDNRPPGITAQPKNLENRNINIVANIHPIPMIYGSFYLL